MVRAHGVLVTMFNSEYRWDGSSWTEPLRRDDQGHMVSHDGISIAVDLHYPKVIVKSIANVDKRWESFDLALEHVG